MDLRMYRMGSDPEFVFCTVKEWSHQIIPASSVITTNKNLGLSSFIGTDGHAATAEFRPRPAHNLRLHLYDLAAAIDATDNYIRKHKKYGPLDVKMFAQPYVTKEPLGGHIHMSMFVNDPVMKEFQTKYNRSFDREWKQYDPSAMLPNISASEMPKLNAFQATVLEGKTMGMDNFMHTMHYLLLPFENWSQSWPSRLNRNSKYGGSMSNDNVRRMWSPRPNMPKYNEWAYLHYEYRTPSSWLTNPWFAYCYFALAKLTMLNWGMINKIVVNGLQPLKIPGDSMPHNDLYFQQFKDRLYGLESKGLKTSKDLDDLKPALRLISERREEWSNPFYAIDVPAWRKLL